jgi:hypothetical protein
VAFFFHSCPASQGKKRGKKNTQRSCEKGAKKIQVASPHLLIFFFLFSIFKVHFVGF